MPALLQQSVQWDQKEPAESADERGNREGDGNAGRHRQQAHRDAEEHARRQGPIGLRQRDEFAGQPCAHHDTDGNHRIQVRGHDVARDPQCDRNPGDEQETQSRSGTPEHTGADHAEARVRISHQVARSVSELAQHDRNRQLGDDARRRQPGDQEVCSCCATITNSDYDETARHIPVGERAARDRSDQNRGDRRGLHQSVGLHQPLRGSQLRQDSILRRRVGRGADTDQAVGNERVETEQHAQRTDHLESVGEEHHSALGARVGERSHERGEQNVGADKELLQDRRRPVRVMIDSQECQRAEQQRVVRHRGEELRQQHGDHAARPERHGQPADLSGHELPPRWRSPPAPSS